MRDWLFRQLRNCNIILIITISILAGYIVLMPSFPSIIFALSFNKFEGFAYNSPEATNILGAVAQQLPPIPQENRVVIPAINVNALISEGIDDSALLVGMWRTPESSTPDKGSNTVIAGHRYLHTSGPDTFYNFDKLKIGNKVLVYWQRKEYTYTIFEITEVNPDQTQIEYATTEPIITLYTCSPLWTSEKRLVVKAKLQ